MHLGSVKYRAMVLQVSNQSYNKDWIWKYWNKTNMLIFVICYTK